VSVAVRAARRCGAAVRAEAEGGRVSDEGPLDGRVAIVTGGSRGIGRAIATLLAEDGAAVVVSGRDADRLQRSAKELEARGGAVLGVVADAVIREDADRLVDAAKQRFAAWTSSSQRRCHPRRPPRAHEGRGLGPRHGRQPPRRVLMTRAATKLMIRQKSGGRVINIASTAGAMATRDRRTTPRPRRGSSDSRRRRRASWRTGPFWSTRWRRGSSRRI